MPACGAPSMNETSAPMAPGETIVSGLTSSRYSNCGWISAALRKATLLPAANPPLTGERTSSAQPPQPRASIAADIASAVPSPEELSQLDQLEAGHHGSPEVRRRHGSTRLVERFVVADGLGPPPPQVIERQVGGHLRHPARSAGANEVVVEPQPDKPDFKERQSLAWGGPAAGYHSIAQEVQPLAERLLEVVRVTAADEVLDAAAGTGITATGSWSPSDCAGR